MVPQYSGLCVQPTGNELCFPAWQDAGCPDDQSWIFRIGKGNRRLPTLWLQQSSCWMFWLSNMTTTQPLGELKENPLGIFSDHSKQSQLFQWFSSPVFPGGFRLRWKKQKSHQIILDTIQRAKEQGDQLGMVGGRYEDQRTAWIGMSV